MKKLPHKGVNQPDSTPKRPMKEPGAKRTSTRNVYNDIALERMRQDDKWGEQNHEDFVWLAVATEELGESAQAILHDEFGGDAADTLRDELVQTAAVLIQWIECIDRRQAKEDADATK